MCSVEGLSAYPVQLSALECKFARSAGGRNPMMIKMSGDSVSRTLEQRSVGENAKGRVRENADVVVRVWVRNASHFCKWRDSSKFGHELAQHVPQTAASFLCRKSTLGATADADVGQPTWLVVAVLGTVVSSLSKSEGTFRIISGSIRPRV